MEVPAAFRKGAVGLGALRALKCHPNDWGAREERLREQVQPGERASAADLTSVFNHLMERLLQTEPGSPQILTVLG